MKFKYLPRMYTCWKIVWMKKSLEPIWLLQHLSEVWSRINDSYRTGTPMTLEQRKDAFFEVIRKYPL